MDPVERRANPQHASDSASAHATSSTHSSHSSAVDFDFPLPTLTPNGPSSSNNPHSSDLDPLDGGRRGARKRTSWGRVESGQDPLTLSLADMHPTEYAIKGVNTPSPSRSTFPNPSPSPHITTEDDLFFTSPLSRPPTYPSTGPGTSSSSSLFSRDSTVDLQQPEEYNDESYLTADVAHDDGSSSMNVNGLDPEVSFAASPRSRSAYRRSRFSATPSPGRLGRQVSKSIRRVSQRVANVAGMPMDVAANASDQKGKHRHRVEDSEFDGAPTIPNLSEHMDLRGTTLGVFGPSNPIRLAMFRFLVSPWTEPFILCLIIINAIVLTVQSSRSLTQPADGNPIRIKGYFHAWEDYALFVLFILFTLEAFARICVSGFLLDPEIPLSSAFSSPFPSLSRSNSKMGPNTSALSRKISLQNTTGRLGPRIAAWLDDLALNLSRPFTLPGSSRPPTHVHGRTDTTTSLFTQSTGYLPPMMEKNGSGVHLRQESSYTMLLQSGKSEEVLKLPFQLTVMRAHEVTRRNLPYLRHSWNRIDYIAIVSFWIAFTLANLGLERGEHHIGAFRAMSVLRTARLLSITSGTSTIMRSLKTARPILTSVAYFVVFAILLFSIIGLQTFQGSYRRTCYLLPTLGEGEVQVPNQFCGGYVNSTTLEHHGFIKRNGGNGEIKGYICPAGSICKEASNQQSNSQSFDTIYNAAMQVVIIASANGWSPIMYAMIDSEYFASCFFFIAAILVLNFWLINLFVAVITNTFGAIRADTKKSAFGAAPIAPVTEDENSVYAAHHGRLLPRNFHLKMLYEKLRYMWVAFALASLVLQATRTTDLAETHKSVLDLGELVITGLFDVEIVIRFLIELPDWRNFFKQGLNLLDLFLAIVTSIIQIPAIRNSNVYPWLTGFQLARFYRVILEVPRMKPLMLRVFGNMYGLANMTLFLLLVNYIAALVTIQLLRGDIPSSVTMNFGQVFTAFLGVYQVFSSENWPDVLYGAIGAESSLGQAALIALFVIGWFLFANFIVLQMFIAVINENFDVAAEAKDAQQGHSSGRTQQFQKHVAWIRQFNPYRWIKPSPNAQQLSAAREDIDLPLRNSRHRKDGSNFSRNSYYPARWSGKKHSRLNKLFAWLEQLYTGSPDDSDIALASLGRSESLLRNSTATSNGVNKYYATFAEQAMQDLQQQQAEDEYKRRRESKARFIRAHPTYDKTFWILSQKNPLRKLCQRLVYPASGERLFGQPHSPIEHTIFQTILLLAVIGGIVVEGIATPTYRRNFFLENGRIRGAWFDLAESAFGLTLFIEFLIKIIADGLVFTPNSYFRTLWNFVDFWIMAGILVNLSTELVFIGGLSRFTRSLKALRALRLVTLIDRMRTTFEDLIISGALRIMDAALLAILYMIPYAVWGLNIFAGKMNECNDSSSNITGASDCIYEYTNTVYGDSFGFPVPRVWANPSPSTTFSFDSFRASLLILFEIVSLEGWIDVLTVATSITGAGKQPQTNASQFNAIFFLIYNLMGGVVILTLFVSIIIANFRAKTGAASTTQAQKEWEDLQKLLKRQQPSKRPDRRPSRPFRAWCFDRAVRKHGIWSKFMTTLFFIHVIVLMTQTFGSSSVTNGIRNYFFLVITALYVGDVHIRLYGLGWHSFRANGWNMFDVVVACGSFTTTVISQLNDGLGNEMQQLQRLFLVCIAFKLVQRVNSLNKLFKTAVASLPVVISLLGLWLILFLFFSIMFLEVFGLTKWYSAETRDQNFSTIGSALLMLAFMSTGEGWNQYMHDYTLSYPRCTLPSLLSSDSDCGSVGWAFTLFIAWNLLSMYIFVNMFTGVVVQSFGYVMQTTGGTKSITREEMRAFKKVWGECANKRTGQLERSDLGAFFHRLRGVFEMKIYPADYSVRNLCAYARDESELGIDVARLNQLLSDVDRNAIRERRRMYIRVFYEAQILSADKGIGFTDMLLLLAGHRLISSEALKPAELTVRREYSRLATNVVKLERVRSILDMCFQRHRLLREMQEQRAGTQPIPMIVVETTPSTPAPIRTQDITSPGNRGYPAQPESPWHSPLQTPTSLSPRDFSAMPELDLNLEPASGLKRKSRRISDISMLSDELRRDPSPRQSMTGSPRTDKLHRHNSWIAVSARVADKSITEPPVTEPP